MTPAQQAAQRLAATGLAVTGPAPLPNKMTLDTAQIGERLRIQDVAGERAFRRRLLELGLVPGTPVELKRVAPMGDPFEILVRGCSLSIRRAEAKSISVVRQSELDRQASPITHESLALQLEQGSIA